MLVYWLSGSRIVSGVFGAGDITAIIEYAIMALFSVMMAQFVILSFPRAMECSNRIGEVLSYDPQIKDKTQSDIELTDHENVLSFENVSFRYADSDEYTLQDLDFVCKKGETTAVIGGTGSGKSTVASLMLRFNDVTDGSIRLCGVDIRDMPQGQLRDNVSYVQQRAWLFSGTIVENLRYGNKSGEILSKVTSDLDKISEALQTGLLRFITSLGTIIGSFVFMFYFSPLLTLIFIAFTAVSFGITKIVADKNLDLSSERQEKVAVLTGLAEEYYTGRNVIRAYNNEKSSTAAMNKAIEDIAAANERTDFLTNSVNPSIRFLSRLSQMVILLIGCFRMVKGFMTFGAIQAYFQYMGMCSEPLTEAAYMINSMQSAFASAERTFEFLDDKEEIKDTEHPVPLERAKGVVTFENVSFGYSHDKILMKNISFTAKQGQKIAIVGATGAGKTTLVNLLMRFYEVDSGKITVDGITIADLTRKTLRSNFGMVCRTRGYLTAQSPKILLTARKTRHAPKLRRQLKWRRSITLSKQCLRAMTQCLITTP